jgi:hypothetical protein
MRNKPLYLLLIYWLSVTVVQSQGDQPVRLRIMQLSYLPPSSVAIDIYLDETLVLEDIGFPFATDYFATVSGEHVLKTVISDQADKSAATMLTLEPGHSYSVIASGDYSQQVTFMVVDETELLAGSSGSTATIVNLTGQPISNITVDDVLLLPEIPTNGYGFLALPDLEATIGGMIGDLSYSETFIPHANTDFLIAVTLMPTGEPQIIFHRSSRLTVAEYLQSIHEGAQFALIAGMIAETDLLNSLEDDSAYTMFLPVNAAVDQALAAGISFDTAQLSNLLAGHATMQNLPPHLLPQHQTVTTLAGNTVSIDFGATASGYWEIEGAPILWDVRLANGVIYGIDGMIRLSQ